MPSNRDLLEVLGHGLVELIPVMCVHGHMQNTELDHTGDNDFGAGAGGAAIPVVVARFFALLLPLQVALLAVVDPFEDPHVGKEILIHLHAHAGEGLLNALFATVGAVS